jgi:very-short-patch-repair endonuclease
MKFVRQEPVGPYIIDLVCREQRLVIEVDGGQHAESPRDAIRDRWLRNHGYRVLRFWNNDVITNTDGVLEAIVDTLQGGRLLQPVPAMGEDRPLSTSRPG